jgi:hypothetical protein
MQCNAMQGTHEGDGGLSSTPCLRFSFNKQQQSVAIMRSSAATGHSMAIVKAGSHSKIAGGV